MVLEVKNLPTNSGDIRDKGSIPESGRLPGGGHSNPLQCSCLENPLGTEAWQAIVHKVTELSTAKAPQHTHIGIKNAWPSK